jgi:hypothetical protein
VLAPAARHRARIVPEAVNPESKESLEDKTDSTDLVLPDTEEE